MGFYYLTIQGISYTINPLSLPPTALQYYLSAHGASSTMMEYQGVLTALSR
jgi:hypothetical protein